MLFRTLSVGAFRYPRELGPPKGLAIIPNIMSKKIIASMGEPVIIDEDFVISSGPFSAACANTVGVVASNIGSASVSFIIIPPIG